MLTFSLFSQQRSNHETLKPYTTTERGRIKNYPSKKVISFKSSNVLTMIGGMAVWTASMVLYRVRMSNFSKMIMLRG